MLSSRLLRGVTRSHESGEDEPAYWLPASRREALLRRLAADAETVRAALLDAAQREAEQLVAAARAEALADRERGRREGFAAGRAEGLAAGAAAAELLQAAVRHAASVQPAVLAACEAELVELALAIAEQVVGEAARDHERLAVDAARHALEAAVGAPLRIRVHPGDVEPVRAALACHDEPVAVAGDDTISLGSCVVDLANGAVEMRIESRFASVKEALRGSA